jgi:hypothetical protein
MGWQMRQIQAGTRAEDQPLIGGDVKCGWLDAGTLCAGLVGHETPHICAIITTSQDFWGNAHMSIKKPVVVPNLKFYRDMPRRMFLAAMKRADQL